MNTNQIFDFKRFGRYAKGTFALSYKQTLMNIGVLVLLIFLMSLLVMNNGSNWNQKGWLAVFIPIFFGAGLALSGYAFAPFRSREKTITELMLPVTALEKFLYEFLLRIVAFVLLYPLFFYVFSSLAVFISNSFYTGMTRTVNGIQSFPYHFINFGELRNPNPNEDLFYMILSFAIFVFSLAFAGAATFIKNPLVKTIVFVGAVITLVIGYIYMMVEKFKLYNPWLKNGLSGKNVTSEQMFVVVSCIVACASLIVLAYAFFKVKEKEIA